MKKRDEIPIAAEILRVPGHGFMRPVEVRTLPWRRARSLVEYANRERTIRRKLEKASPVSEMEIALLAGLLYYGLEPERQAPIGPFDADFLFPDARLVVEVDGAKWHNRSRDKTRDEIMEREGYNVLRFDGRVVFRDPLQCAREVADLYGELARAAA